MIISPIYPRIPDVVTAGSGTTHTRQTPDLKVIVTDTVCSGARIFRNPGDVSRKGRDSTTPWDGNTSIRYPGLNSSVLIGAGTTVFPTRTGS